MRDRGVPKIGIVDRKHLLKDYMRANRFEVYEDWDKTISQY